MNNNLPKEDPREYEPFLFSSASGRRTGTPKKRFSPSEDIFLLEISEAVSHALNTNSLDSWKELKKCLENVYREKIARNSIKMEFSFGDISEQVGIFRTMVVTEIQLSQLSHVIERVYRRTLKEPHLQILGVREYLEMLFSKILNVSSQNNIHVLNVAGGRKIQTFKIYGNSIGRSKCIKACQNTRIIICSHNCTILTQ
jgi:hypothetical protein